MLCVALLIRCRCTMRLHRLQVPSLIVVNLQLPLEPPAMFSAAMDGPTLHCVFYLGLSEEAAHLLAAAAADGDGVGGGGGGGGDDGGRGGSGGGGLPPALRLLRDYCAAAEEDAAMRGRFKAIGLVNNVEQVRLVRE
jgi:Protein ENHANCED DISEASE RESISTANCE 2, C-terminal